MAKPQSMVKERLVRVLTSIMIMLTLKVFEEDRYLNDEIPSNHHPVNCLSFYLMISH